MAHRFISGSSLCLLLSLEPLLLDSLVDDGQLLSRERSKDGKAALGVILRRKIGHGVAEWQRHTLSPEKNNQGKHRLVKAVTVARGCKWAA